MAPTPRWQATASSRWTRPTTPSATLALPATGALQALARSAAAAGEVVVDIPPATRHDGRQKGDGEFDNKARRLLRQ